MPVDGFARRALPRRAGATSAIAVLAAVCCAFLFAPPQAGAFGFVGMFGKNGGLGGQGVGNNEFVNPTSIVIGPAPNHTVYVGDQFDNTIRAFNSDGTFKTRWGSTGSGPNKFLFLNGLAVDDAGNVYASDFSNGTVQEFDPNGSLIRTIGGPGAGKGLMSGSASIAVGPGANPHVWVAETVNHRVSEFLADGTFVRMWGKDVIPGGGTGAEICAAAQATCQIGISGSLIGEFNAPNGITLNANGNIFVADYNSSLVSQFTTAGAGVDTFNPGVSPNGLASDPQDGKLWVVSQFGSVAKEFATTAGHAVSQTLGTLNYQSGDSGFFAAPKGIAVAADGSPYVADTYNHRVETFSPAGAVTARWGKNGGIGSGLGLGNGEFFAPAQIAARGGRVAVAEAGSSRVEVFDANGGFIERFGKNGGDGTAGSKGGEFAFAPSGVAFAANGDIFVADTYNQRIQHFTAAGDFIEAAGTDVDSVNPSTGFEICVVAANCKFATAAPAPPLGDRQFKQPNQIAFGPDGLLYVLEYAGHRIEVVDPANGYSLVRKIGANLGDGSVGSGDGDFTAPVAIAIDAQGDIYVTDPNASRITKFSSTGQFLVKWGSAGSGPGQFSRPEGITVTPSGAVYIGDRDNNRVQVFDSSGNYQSEYGGFGSDEGQFSQPTGLGSDECGHVYVSDLDNERIQIFGESPPPCSAATGTPPARVSTLITKLKIAKVKKFKNSLKVSVTCDQACSIKLIATGKIGKKTIKAKGSGALKKSGTVVITVKFSKKNAKKIVAAIRKHKKPKFAVALAASTTAGAKSAKTASIKLKK
jgi:sugar lactone lactonase YvrE